MSALEKRDNLTPAQIMEKVLLSGDLSKLSADERVQYYSRTCESVGLNPLTRPLEYITLNGKLTLYARKDCTDQLRAINQVSINIVAREEVAGCYVVTARATMPSGRCDESIGAVPIETLKGEARSNALMKCETKAKRRVTLSICGMGMLDETEVDSIPGAKIGETSAKLTEAPRTIAAPKKIIGSAVINGEKHEAHLTEHSGIKWSKQEDAGWTEDLGGPVKTKSSPPPLPPLAELVEQAQKAGEPDEPSIYINREKQLWLIEKFRENLPERFHPHADQLRREYLHSNGFVGPDGKGSSKLIPDRQFKKVAANMLNWAKEQQ